MKFKLTMTGAFLNTCEKEIYEKLGFTFSQYNDYQTADKWYLQEDSTIEIGSLEDILEFVKEYGQIVLTEGEIEIYNNYRE